MTDAPQTDAVRTPLFYRKPVPISSIEHAAWRLTPGDYAFAAQTAYVPIVVAEAAAASRTYPIVFAGGDASPLALTGLEQTNLFVEDGQWAHDAYIPAYVRRYPFGFLSSPDRSRFILALDVESPNVVADGEAGEPLFEDGKPTALTAQALTFCDAFQGEADATLAFCEALKASGVLVDRRADITLPDGRKMGLDGFKVVDAEAFAKLADETVVDWHRKGWLAVVHFHLASMERFASLLERRAARDTAAPTPATDKPARKSR